MGDIFTDRLLLRLMPLGVLQASIDGDAAAVSSGLDLTVPEPWAEAQSLVRMRLEQVQSTPAYAPWSLRAIALRSSKEMVGYINCHDEPRDGPIEPGYEIFPQHRGRGYASEAVRGLLAFAGGQGITKARFAIAPGNAASLAIVRRLGARRIGSQIDEIDGPEDVYMLELPRRS